MSLSRRVGRPRSNPGSNSMVPTAAVLPTLKMLTVPVEDPRRSHDRSDLFGQIVHVSRSFGRDGNLLLIGHGVVHRL